jgi:alanyl aminopeptidase
METMLRRAGGLVAFVLAACPAPAPTTPTTPSVTITQPPPPAPPPIVPAGLEPPQPTLRLPGNFRPTGYEARLAIDPSKPTFDGSIAITGEISERSSVIWLHGRHLDIQRATATATHGDPVVTANGIASAITVTPRGEDLLEVRADPPLDPGKWQLALDYTGEIDKVETQGAFVETVDGANYVYSQFESIYARRVFPCVDEPGNKVPWQLTLDVPKDLVAVANTPAVHTYPMGTTGKRVEFAKSKPLPSYLVAFGVGPFDIVDAGKTRDGTPIRIVALKGRAKDAAWAAKTAGHIVELLEDYFGTPYPYEKLDLMTIPTTVGFGAMENAGLVTFAENLMLFDRLTQGQKRAWISVAAHELAHQWFGDLVTMAWWDDIWLNEGFASWMGTKITGRFEPKWHDELASVMERNGALDADSLVTARQIRQPIEKADDILTAFDGITYSKGEAVLAMFEAYLGPDVFQRGVREYLKAHAYGSTTSADFIAAVGTAADKDIAPAFTSFLDQGGEPELDAKLACDRGAPRVELAQQRYVPPGAAKPPAGKPWIFPVCVAYERGGKRAEACTLVSESHATLALETKACPRWLMANVGGRGYYRWVPSAQQLAALRDEAWPLLAWTERIALFFEISDAVRSHHKMPLQLALSFVPKMLAGGDRFTIGMALGLPLGLDRLVADDQRAKYEAWLRQTFGPGAQQMGMLPKDADDLDAESSRRELFGAVAWSGRDPELVKQALAAVDKWRDASPAVRGLIVSIAADASGDVHDKLMRDVKAEHDRDKREEMYGAIAGVRDAKRREMALQIVLDSSVDIKETMWILFGSANEAMRQVTEKFFRDHEAELVKRIPPESVPWFTGVFTGACDPKRRDELADFVTKHFSTFPGGERGVKQSIEGMDQCLAGRALLEPEVRAWLGGYRIPVKAPPPRKH